MPKGRKVDKALVENVKETHKKYPMIKYLDVGKMCGISADTVSKILNGDYDDLLGEPSGGGSLRQGGAVDVKELERLVAEVDDYLRIIAFALIVLIDPDVKETHDMCARWRKNMEFGGYRFPADGVEQVGKR